MTNKIGRVAMPEQDPNIRNSNFKEVTFGYTPALMKEEAERCISCKNPRCEKGCPVNVPIRDFITLLKDADVSSAYKIISATNSLPAICGRVCPQEEQCEKLCILGIKGEPVAIGRLERYAADWALETGENENIAIPEKNGIKVAIIGAGPAGLTCAGDLAKRGFDVTIFEAFHKAGGVLVYGIPEFRLPKVLVEKEISTLTKLGVTFEFNTIVGKTVMIDELFEEGFKSLFIGSGAGLPRFMNIPGENLIGVYSANEYLTRINLMKAYEKNAATPILRSKKVVVVGGGNVAMDAARSAKRLGAEVHIVYRRSLDELPARTEEVHHAKEEGIIFDLLCNPVEIIGKETVKAIKCVRMELGEPDDSGRRRPVVIKNSEFIISADAVIIAVGTAPNPMITSVTPDLNTYDWGGLKVDEETMSTSIPGVYAGGDAVTGAATVILAMGAGKTAAIAMEKYCLEGRR